ncbi:MAG: ribulose-phosphate 3-epimerase, partial [Candidatus Riesia sp.]|nr:ribulose-phosphate 3-epimerase [Candidatus Riesia sp.]
MRNIIVSPSILSTDFIKLKNTIDIINKSESEWVHIDVMDGVFVPNISFGFPILKSIRDNTDKKLDVHLMIVNPDNYIDEFTKHGADIVTVHYEACNHLNRTLNKIKTNGVLSGVALNPHTSVNLLKDVIDDLDVVLVMSVNPGYGG